MVTILQIFIDISSHVQLCFYIKQFLLVFIICIEIKYHVGFYITKTLFQFIAFQILVHKAQFTTDTIKPLRYKLQSISCHFVFIFHRITVINFNQSGKEKLCSALTDICVWKRNNRCFLRNGTNGKTWCATFHSIYRTANHNFHSSRPFTLVVGHTKHHFSCGCFNSNRKPCELSCPANII